MDYLDLELLLKLGISALLGLIIGLERELKRKPLGLKTSLVISIISCLLTIVSIESAYIFPGSDNVRIQMDPLRLAAQIVSGIGFLGAGVILRRGNDHISGLTTAAMIWGAAGIGITVGAGFYIEAVAGVILLIISVEFIPYTLIKIGPKKLLKRDIIIKITVSKQESLERVIEKLQEDKITISHTRIKDQKDSSSHLLELKTRVNINRPITNVYYSISKIDDVQSIEIIS
ncbi:MgtC/SapB family protein [Lederbergia wuyishanensis]|uniref:Mg2+ transporter-C (MgtC) family protein n=1 Tax=Lederbergia wuyishanensis TaxID=1347903 RepID=A0ABU0D952_9BACI|nr:MgtC/SapB family protein [Lederbergia wuyishanensis]MCJ8009482.1 MgtC/SapB family protein [Lederbergia wuyishanensis]MDQ0344908.1 putative Mg2+ transporter-C (MgtC) family protein [Lederbergia wuyishanensis]